jgi:uncharacterized protein with HEPN domain
MGEAATKIDKEFRADRPEIPWRQMIGLRTHTVHNYLETDFVSSGSWRNGKCTAMIPILKKFQEVQARDRQPQATGGND